MCNLKEIPRVKESLKFSESQRLFPHVDVDTVAFPLLSECFSLIKHAAYYECTCANRALYFGVMAECVTVGISGRCRMAPIFLFCLNLLLSHFQMGNGGIVKFFITFINNFTVTLGLF